VPSWEFDQLPNLVALNLVDFITYCRPPGFLLLRLSKGAWFLHAGEINSASSYGVLSERARMGERLRRNTAVLTASA
jgi:hypothetical protein